MAEEKKPTIMELEDQMFQLRHQIERIEDKEWRLRRRQAEINESFDNSLFQMRQLNHYALSQEDANFFNAIMQRQTHLRLEVQEENDKRLKRYQTAHEDLEAQLRDIKNTYNALFE